MYTCSFKKADCWQKGWELSVLMYRITINFPAEEKLRIVSQMRRVAIPIASTTAKGSSAY